MTDLFLGIIAAAVLVMAAIQVALVVFAARVASRVGQAVTQLQEDVRPILSHLQTVSAEVAKLAASATTSMQRTEQTMAGLMDRVDVVGQRVEEAVASLQEGILAPARDGFAFVAGLRSFFAGFGRPSAPRRQRPTAAEEEDALFIG